MASTVQPWLEETVIKEITAAIAWHSRRQQSNEIKPDPDDVQYSGDDCTLRSEVSSTSLRIDCPVQLVKVTSLKQPVTLAVSDSKSQIPVSLNRDAVARFEKEIDGELDASMKGDILLLRRFSISITTVGPIANRIGLNVLDLDYVTTQRRTVGQPVPLMQSENIKALLSQHKDSFKATPSSTPATLSTAVASDTPANLSTQAALIAPAGPSTTAAAITNAKVPTSGSQTIATVRPPHNPSDGSSGDAPGQSNDQRSRPRQTDNSLDSQPLSQLQSQLPAQPNAQNAPQSQTTTSGLSIAAPTLMNKRKIFALEQDGLEMQNGVNLSQPYRAQTMQRQPLSRPTPQSKHLLQLINKNQTTNPVVAPENGPMSTGSAHVSPVLAIPDQNRRHSEQATSPGHPSINWTNINAQHANPVNTQHGRSPIVPSQSYPPQLAGHPHMQHMQFAAPMNQHGAQLQPTDRSIADMFRTPTGRISSQQPTSTAYNPRGHISRTPQPSNQPMSTAYDRQSNYGRPMLLNHHGHASLYASQTPQMTNVMSTAWSHNEAQDAQRMDLARRASGGQAFGFHHNAASSQVPWPAPVPAQIPGTLPSGVNLPSDHNNAGQGGLSAGPPILLSQPIRSEVNTDTSTSQLEPVHGHGRSSNHEESSATTVTAQNVERLVVARPSFAAAQGVVPGATETIQGSRAGLTTAHVLPQDITANLVATQQDHLTPDASGQSVLPADQAGVVNIARSPDRLINPRQEPQRRSSSIIQSDAASYQVPKVKQPPAVQPEEPSTEYTATRPQSLSQNQQPKDSSTLANAEVAPVSTGAVTGDRADHERDSDGGGEDRPRSVQSNATRQQPQRPSQAVKQRFATKLRSFRVPDDQALLLAKRSSWVPPPVGEHFPHPNVPVAILDGWNTAQNEGQKQNKAATPTTTSHHQDHDRAPQAQSQLTPETRAEKQEFTSKNVVSDSSWSVGSDDDSDSEVSSDRWPATQPSRRQLPPDSDEDDPAPVRRSPRKRLPSDSDDSSADKPRKKRVTADGTAKSASNERCVSSQDRRPEDSPGEILVSTARYAGVYQKLGARKATPDDLEEAVPRALPSQKPNMLSLQTRQREDRERSRISPPSIARAVTDQREPTSTPKPLATQEVVLESSVTTRQAHLVTDELSFSKAVLGTQHERTTANKPPTERSNDSIVPSSQPPVSEQQPPASERRLPGSESHVAKDASVLAADSLHTPRERQASVQAMNTAAEPSMLDKKDQRTTPDLAAINLTQSPTLQESVAVESIDQASKLAQERTNIVSTLEYTTSFPRTGTAKSRRSIPWMASTPQSSKRETLAVANAPKLGRDDTNIETDQVADEALQRKMASPIGATSTSRREVKSRSRSVSVKEELTDDDYSEDGVTTRLGEFVREWKALRPGGALSTKATVHELPKWKVSVLSWTLHFMSAERSSSAVRNLRSIFEHKESEATAKRQRSRSGSVEPSREGRRPLSKVRSSFVAVETGRAMEEATKADTIAEHDAEAPMVADSTASRRRSSFSANTNDSEELGLKRVITHESEKRGRDQNVETIPEQAIESSPEGTPAVTPKLLQDILVPSSKGSVKTTDAVQPPAHPDKPTTGAEEETGALKPADPTAKAAVTGGEALSTAAPASIAPVAAVQPPAMTSRSQVASANAPAATAATTENATPTPKPALAAHSNGTARSQENPTQVRESTTNVAAPPAKTEPSTEVKPVTKADPKPEVKPATKIINRKPSRTSLNASTSSATSRAAAAKQEPLPSRPKPRETTKPAEISAHLLAPTAASRARHGDDSAAKPTAKPDQKPPRTSLASKPAPRTSLAGRSRPGSRSEQAAVRKPPVPAADEGFLERMMRPTAASQNRAQEKFETRSPPRQHKPAPVAQKKTPATRPNAPASKEADVSAAADVSTADAGAS